jgi:hypothetical protein
MEKGEWRMEKGNSDRSVIFDTKAGDTWEMFLDLESYLG